MSSYNEGSAVARPVFRTSVAACLIAVFFVQVGCSRSPETAPWSMEKQELLSQRILQRNVEDAVVVANTLERHGELLVQVEESDPHTLGFVMQQELVRGDGTTTVDIVDQQTQQMTRFIINDETGVAFVQTQTTQLRLDFNPDGTVLVENRMAKNEQEAGLFIIQSHKMDGVSDYTLTALLDILEQYLPEDSPARGAVVTTIVVVVWLVGSSVLCSREYKRNGCKITNGMSQYCRDYCRQVGCWC